MSRGSGPKYPNSLAAQGFKNILKGAKDELFYLGGKIANYKSPKNFSAQQRMGRRIPSYKKGGKVKKTGLALVHKGERVIPVKKAKGKFNAKKFERSRKSYYGLKK